MGIDFSKVQIDQTLAEKAGRDAEKNWDWWSEDFKHAGSLSELPILQDYPRWRGFGADYSVFRGIPIADIDPMRIWISRQTSPKDLRDLHSKLIGEFPGWNRISLVSKILTMWRPSDFAMWDTLARAGLRKLHDVRGRRYYKNDAQNYEVFKEDFFDLLGAKGPELLQLSRVDPKKRSGFEACCSARLLDNYLMWLGRQE